jgi:hypothetical protein
MLSALKTVAVLCIPALPTAIAMGACPLDERAGSAVKARPPPEVFGVVWPLLFLGLGVALCRLQCKWPIVALSALLALWQALYSSECCEDKLKACWCLLACCFVGLVALSFSASEGDSVSTVALSGLVAWLVFAQQMNMLEVQVA